jgi:D-arabinose 5-phosphate isomerase GutQ
MTPPDPEGGDPLLLSEPAISAIETATHVFSTECSALANLQRIYETDRLARGSMERAVTQIAGTIRGGGKLIICGVGKSGLIAKKVVATMNSMAIQSCFLHPTEALHGDLGMVRQVMSPTAPHSRPIFISAERQD